MRSQHLHAAMRESPCKATKTINFKKFKKRGWVTQEVRSWRKNSSLYSLWLHKGSSMLFLLEERGSASQTQIFSFPWLLLPKAADGPDITNKGSSRGLLSLKGRRCPKYPNHKKLITAQAANLPAAFPQVSEQTRWTCSLWKEKVKLFHIWLYADLTMTPPRDPVNVQRKMTCCSTFSILSIQFN